MAQPDKSTQHICGCFCLYDLFFVIKIITFPNTKANNHGTCRGLLPRAERSERAPRRQLPAYANKKGGQKCMNVFTAGKER